MDAFRSRRQKKISLKQEKSVAEALGGRTQAASGATRLGGGGDVRATGFRIECKYTEKDYYSIKLKELQKLRTQAHRSLEQPIMQVAFVDNLGRRTEFAILKSSHRPTAVFPVSSKSLRINLDHISHFTLRAAYCFYFTEEANHLWKIITWADFLSEKDEC